MKKQLSPESLQDILWDTLQKVRDRKMKPPEANSITFAAKEILNSARIQMQYAILSGRKLSENPIAMLEQEGRKLKYIKTGK